MTVGQIEKKTQARVVKLFREQLAYDYLGNWIDREDNRNIEPDLLRAFLKRQGHDESLIAKALYQIEKAAGDTSKSLYDRNRAVYELLRYGVKVKADVGENTETVWLIDWKRPLDRALTQLCRKERFLELIHDFILFDAGRKKLCRHSQYFAVRASQEYVGRHEGGIIWNTQGSGKSLIMVWLAKWIREHVHDARVLIITDRTELDEQIERVFFGVNEEIYRTKSCADLIARLNSANPWLLCSLIHKFGGKEEGEEVGDIPGYIQEVKKSVAAGLQGQGKPVRVCR
jgi:type I site-specific restriction-modification system R (restriction) subunit